MKALKPYLVVMDLYDHQAIVTTKHMYQPATDTLQWCSKPNLTFYSIHDVLFLRPNYN